MSQAVKLQILQNAVHPIDELRQVKNQADQYKTQSGKSLDYDGYVNLLLSAASHYDTEHMPKKPPNFARSTKCSVYQADTDFTQDIPTDLDSYDIDSSIDHIQANEHCINSEDTCYELYVSAQNTGTRLPFELWKQLTPKDQSTWKSLSIDAKKLLLGKVSSPPSTNFTPRRKVNQHDTVTQEEVEVNLPEQLMGSEGDVNDTTQETDTLLAHATNRHSKVPPSELAKLLSTSIARYQGKPTGKSNDKGGTSVSRAEQEQITVNGVKYTRQANVHHTYAVSAHKSESNGSLVDRGANGGIAGADVRVIETLSRRVDVQGIDNHQVTDIAIATVGGVVDTQRGPVIAIMHQYAYTGKGKSIHSCIQLEHFKNDVNDKSVKVPGGLQWIQTLDGYVIPLNIKNGLAYLDIRPYTDEEFDKLPSVILTDESTWDTTVLDHNLTDDEQWYDAVSDLQDDPTTNLFDEFGNYRNRVTVQESEFFDALDELPGISEEVDHCVMYQLYNVIHQAKQFVFSREVSNREPNFAALRPLFGYLPTDVIKKTFQHTTQYARIPMSTVLKKRYKAANPALNIPQRDEPVATDTVYADTPAVDSGATSAQMFVGLRSTVLDVQGMKSDKEFVNTLEDTVCK